MRGFIPARFVAAGLVLPCGGQYGCALRDCGRRGCRAVFAIGLGGVDAGMRVGNALMENTRENALEVFAQEVKILERQLGLIQLALREYALDDGVDMRYDARGGRIIKGAA